MAKKEEKEKRFIYKKDAELSKAGFERIEDAHKLFEELKAKYPEPGHRVRTRLRSRTNTWDVVVKVRTEVKEQRPLTPAEQQARKDLEFMAHHAGTGA